MEKQIKKERRTKKMQEKKGKRLINDTMQEVINAEPWYKRIFLMPAKYPTYLLAIPAFITALASSIMTILMNVGIIPHDTGAFMNIRLWVPLVLSVIALYNSLYRRDLIKLIGKALEDIEEEIKDEEKDK